ADRLGGGVAADRPGGTGEHRGTRRCHPGHDHAHLPARRGTPGPGGRRQRLRPGRPAGRARTRGRFRPGVDAFAGGRAGWHAGGGVRTRGRDRGERPVRWKRGAPALMIDLLLADDHPVVRAGLRAVLELAEDVQVRAEADTAADAVHCATELRAAGTLDVVLMDLQFGSELAGIGATEQITALPDPPRVLILTTYDTDADILAAVEAGAAGYLLKDAPPEELLAAVRTAAAGQSALAPAVALRMMDRMRAPGRALSAREIDVLTQVAAGLSNQ